MLWQGPNLFRRILSWSSCPGLEELPCAKQELVLHQSLNMLWCLSHWSRIEDLYSGFGMGKLQWTPEQGCPTVGYSCGVIQVGHGLQLQQMTNNQLFVLQGIKICGGSRSSAGGGRLLASLCVHHVLEIWEMNTAKERHCGSISYRLTTVLTSDIWFKKLTNHLQQNWQHTSESPLPLTFFAKCNPGFNLGNSTSSTVVIFLHLWVLNWSNTVLYKFPFVVLYKFPFVKYSCFPEAHTNWKITDRSCRVNRTGAATFQMATSKQYEQTFQFVPDQDGACHCQETVSESLSQEYSGTFFVQGEPFFLWGYPGTRVPVYLVTFQVILKLARSQASFAKPQMGQWRTSKIK